MVLRVIEDVVASSAELAKAYMGSRTPKESVSRPGLQNQVSRGDLTCPSNKNFPSMSSTMSLVPRSSGLVGNLGNSFVTPKIKGQSSGTASDAFGGSSSSSQSAWEQKRISGLYTRVTYSGSFCATTAPGTTNYLSDKTDKESNLNGIFCRTPEAAITSSVSTSISAGIPSNCQSSSSATATKNDSSAATITSASATANASNSFTSSLSVEASIPSFTGPPVFKFSSSVDPSTSVSTLSATSGEATESKTQDTKLGNVGIFPFGSTSAFTGSGSSIFGGTSAASSSAGTTAEVASSGSSSSSGISSTITNSGSGFFSSTFSPVTSTSNGIFGGTSASTSTGNGIFGCTSATTSTGTGLFGDTSATTSTGNGISGGTSATSTVSSIFGGTSFPESGTGSSIFAAKAAVTITGSNIFGFSAPATSTSASQSQGLNPFNAVNTQASAAGTGIGSSTQSTPIQFSSFASSSSFGLTGNATFSSGSSIFGSSASVAKPFSSGSSFGISSSFSETKSLSSSSGIAGGAFGSTWQAPKTPTFGSSSGFSFGSSTSVSAPSGASSIFGSSTGASSSSIFSFTSAAAATPSLPVFGNTSPGLVFGSTPSSNNDQMEDSMVEDTVQASPAVVTFSQQPISPPASGFVFGASNPPAAGSVPFGTRPSMAAPQNPSPFLASGSLEFGGGGSFSLGTNGGDKSARKYVKVRKQRKK
ncbi:hypothetical protein ES332_D04G024200v1 [Gossypium tomentosum]|uniref:Uncharacterized protein n=1 Tax=Gossypium tomentosum TaxID=34277 RepID=A0A5D2L8S9_GOSTO|nr:hypothetical protein ES332_D04G024200v1 [Gossypium tomentosum]